MVSKKLGAAVDEAITMFHLLGRVDLSSFKKQEKKNLRAYFNDARTSTVITESVQKKIAFQKYGVYFSGRIDQARREDEVIRVYDIKYSDLQPKKLIEYYLPQLICYAYALECEVGGIINVKNYSRNIATHICVTGVDVEQEMLNIAKYIKG